MLRLAAFDYQLMVNPGILRGCSSCLTMDASSIYGTSRRLPSASPAMRAGLTLENVSVKMSSYIKTGHLSSLPRLPLEGNIDLTYRCNNKCVHCWLTPLTASEKLSPELSYDEIRSIVLEAKGMGCRTWFVSGGEPMLRADFEDVFRLIADNSLSWTLNTNGTLITPAIAQLLARKGTKLVALYGATAEIHDRVTRTQGSFEATMRGFAYLKEAGADFVVQIVPMDANLHQYDEMAALAQSLSPRSRIGAPWLYFSACGDTERNAEIALQRLTPEDIVKLDPPAMGASEPVHCQTGKRDGVFARCALDRDSFHIDPYGSMSFCAFVKDTTFRYDLRHGSFQECWDKFIPSLSHACYPDGEYEENCGSCETRDDCRWCPAYAYLEHRRYSAKIDYLCAIAAETRRYKQNWPEDHQRHFRLADIAVTVRSDAPFSVNSFAPNVELFQVTGPTDRSSTVMMHHHFNLASVNSGMFGEQLLQTKGISVFRNADRYVYRVPGDPEKPIDHLAICDAGHTNVAVYHTDEEAFRSERHEGLPFPISDQLVLARVLGDRDGCYFHASGVGLNGHGLLFPGASEAGKSTIAAMLKNCASVIGDERIVVLRRHGGFSLHGNWSCGRSKYASTESAPLNAVFFLNQASENRIELLQDKSEIGQRLIQRLVKPVQTKEWWEKMLCLIGEMVDTIPCYDLHFDKSGMIVEVLREFVVSEAAK